MEPVFFKKQSELRLWFEKNHNTETELLVGYYKISSKKDSVTWSQSVDEALCFGWIDGVRRSIDHESYSIRFTPRRSGSNWSQVNLKKVEELTQKGLMYPSGYEAFSKRKEPESRPYSYESTKKETLDESLEAIFQKNKTAWKNFQSRIPSYRKITIRWVMDAKQETTRLRRLNELIAACESGEEIKALRYGKA
jgi:uncharacterized protein YdeI (YjbR/CyaY-like superfamily)